MTTPIMCAKCGAECKREGMAAGYADFPDVGKICYTCSAAIERQWMIDNGVTTLYLSPIIKVGPIGRSYGTYVAGYEVTDWPGRLRFKVFKRSIVDSDTVEVWFKGPDKFVRHGVNAHRFDSQLCECERTTYTKLKDVPL